MRQVVRGSHLRLSAVCMAAVLLGACEDSVQPKREWTPADHGQLEAPLSEDGRAAPPEQESGEGGTEAGGGPERAARALWMVSCAGCHGREGAGGGAGLPPGANVPDFRSAAFQQERSDADLVQAIHEGRGLMPSFSKQLTEQAIVALVAHIRTFASAEGEQDGE